MYNYLNKIDRKNISAFYIIILLKGLDCFFPLWYSEYTSKRVYFFAKKQRPLIEGGKNSKNQEVPQCESK